jgi:hypothetical protein
MFESLLAGRAPFNAEFNKDIAHDFYEGVRCGLLHEACHEISRRERFSCWG